MDLNPSYQTSDTDTPIPPPPPPPVAPNTQPAVKSFPFKNGSFRRHAPAQPQPAAPSALVVVSYKECLKNHAASIGAYAVDGCGEFMPSPNFDSNDPTSLKCAACGCHRNFHRREARQDSNPNSLDRIYPLPLAASGTRAAPAPQQPPLLRGLGLSPSSSTSPSLSIPSPESSPSPPPVSQISAPSYYTSAPQMLLALGSTHDTAPSEQRHRDMSFNSMDTKTENSSGKKRSRTKFSREQKEKMYLFSEKLGWKIQKVEERLVQEFCNEVGVSRGVFKVWMHNNKNTFKKRSETTNMTTDRVFRANNDGTVGFSSNINHPYNFDGSNDDIQIKEDSSTDLHISANESSH